MARLVGTVRLQIAMGRWESCCTLEMELLLILQSKRTRKTQKHDVCESVSPLKKPEASSHHTAHTRLARRRAGAASVTMLHPP